jgi:hypothetical protein
MALRQDEPVGRCTEKPDGEECASDQEAGVVMGAWGVEEAEWRAEVV